MRNLYLKISTAAGTLFTVACALFAAACAHEDSTLPNAEAERYGTFELGSVNCSIATTRADRPIDPSDYDVKVWRVRTSGDELVVGIPSKVSGFKTADAPLPVTLPVGDYLIEVRSPESAIALPAFDSPSYKGAATFSITEENNTSVGVECVQSNIKVTVHYSAELLALLSDKANAKTTVTIDGASLDYRFDEYGAGRFSPELRGGYFDFNPAAQGQTTTSMTVSFSGEIDYADAPENSKTITGIAPGQWQRVLLSIEPGEGGEPGHLVIVFGSEAGQVGDGADWF